MGAVKTHGVRAAGLRLAIAVSAVGYGVVVAVDATEGTLRGPDATTGAIVGYLVAFAGFLLALIVVGDRELSWRWLWLAPVAFRVALLTTTPTLSDDVYRYLWEGHLVAEGADPYAHPVDAPELDQYDVAVRADVNNRTLASPYLPAAHALFAVAAVVAPSTPLTMQVLMVGFDLLTAFLIARLLALAQLPASRLLLYLWNPLVIVEAAHGAHIDVYMTFLAVGALLAAERTVNRGGAEPIRLLSPLLLAMAVLTRPLPLLVLPLLWWRWRWPERVAFGAVITAVVVPVGLAAGWGLSDPPRGTGLFGSILVYAQDFRFNSGIFHWLENGLPAVGGVEARTLTRWLVGAVLALALAGTGYLARGAGLRRRLALVALPAFVYVILTPALHPWYLVLLSAFVPFVCPVGSGRARWLTLSPYLYLSASLVLSYLTYRNAPVFGELAWVRRVEWYPTFVLAAIAAASGWRHARKPVT